MNKLLYDLESDLILDKLDESIDGLKFLLENWKVENVHETEKTISKTLDLKVKDLKKQETYFRINKLLLYSLFVNDERFNSNYKNIERLNKNDVLNLLSKIYQETDKKIEMLKTLIMFKSFMKLEELKND
ncbi:hypothetical protein SOJ_17850 [Staphylococcus sp. OJ82]|uniref:hypothetical protein n=1 Tax=Staphylococcus sp. OJ82 TaxID=1202667 RepID=UPI000281DB4F|nr:hypothetical protein [Staphylococcus sp. OJ82]EJX17496.1 hypothetical protein SOJ_17850 [Staphylococcus sp. OJ82]